MLPNRGLGSMSAGPKARTALVLPGVPFSWASTPDDPALDLVSDLDIRVDVQMTDWTPAIISTFVSKWSTVDSQRSYGFTI